MFMYRTKFLFLWFPLYLWIYIKRINCLTEFRAPCRSLPSLTKEQIELCYRFPDVTYAALEGLEMAIKECQFQFQWNRWNCSSLSTKSRNPHTSNLLKKGYRESAFAYAISAAGVAHSVARACSQGKLLSCGCDPSINRRRMSKSLKEKLERDRKLVLDNFETTNSIISEEYQINEKKTSSWKWGGCSHNMDFGIEFSEMFLDSREKGHDIQSKTNLHNNNAGRKAVFNNMQIRCKCHGMSGSCQLKTCWKSAPEFRIVGKVLKKQFRRAVLVDQSNMGNGKPVVVYKKPKRNKKHYRKHNNQINNNNNNNNNRFNNNNRRNNNNNNNRNTARARRRSDEKVSIKEIKRMEQMLFYYERSPNFCERDLTSDILGTIGRKCNRTSTGNDGCASMCCGRGYNLVREHRIERCNCKFNWCCYVECDNCEYNEWISVCN